MDRAYRLGYCRKCTLRDFSPKHGIICSLTNASADFDQTCDSFKVDVKEAESIKIQEDLIKKEAQKSSTLGLSAIGIKSGVLAGIIAIVGAVIWFIVGLVNGYIFFYPPILFILGIVIFVKGLMNEKRRKIKADETILDSEL